MPFESVKTRCTENESSFVSWKRENLQELLDRLNSICACVLMNVVSIKKLSALLYRVLFLLENFKRFSTENHDCTVGNKKVSVQRGSMLFVLNVHSLYKT